MGLREDDTGDEEGIADVRMSGLQFAFLWILPIIKN